VFAQSIGEAIVTSLLLFFIPYGALSDAVNSGGIDIGNHTSFGFLIASILIITVTLRVSVVLQPFAFYRETRCMLARYK